MSSRPKATAAGATRNGPRPEPALARPGETRVVSCEGTREHT